MDKIISLSSVIVANIGLFASVITASLSYYFTKKHQLKMEDRRLKEEFYRTFIFSLSDIAIDGRQTEATHQKFCESFNSLLLIANKDVLARLMDYHDYFKKPKNVEGYDLEHNRLLTELVKSMKMDLFGQIDLKDFPMLHLIGRKI